MKERRSNYMWAKFDGYCITSWSSRAVSFDLNFAFKNWKFLKNPRFRGGELRMVPLTQDPSCKPLFALGNPYISPILINWRQRPLIPVRERLVIWFSFFSAKFVLMLRLVVTLVSWPVKDAKVSFGEIFKRMLNSFVFMITSKYICKYRTIMWWRHHFIIFRCDVFGVKKRKSCQKCRMDACLKQE